MLEDQIPVAELRKLYIAGNLRQRYSVAAARIKNLDHGPNQVVAAMAALEGFSRAVAVKYIVASGASLEDAYKSVRWANAKELIEKHVLPRLGKSPEAVFEPKDWDLLPEAIAFRNLLVHEATYLHGGTCKVLVDAAVHLFERIAALVGATAGPVGAA